jgi:hypothetical protein
MDRWTTTIETWGQRSCWYEERPVVWEGRVTGVTKTIGVPGGQRARITVTSPRGFERVHEYEATNALGLCVPVMGDADRVFVIRSTAEVPA